MGLSDNLRRLCKERNKSYAQVGAAAGVSRSYIKNLVQDPSRRPSVNVAAGIAKCFDITLDDLLRDQETA